MPQLATDLDAEFARRSVETVEHGAAHDEAVQIVFEGEADRPHDLQAILGGEAQRAPRQAFRDRGGQRVFAPTLVGSDLGGAHGDKDVGQPMLDCLEGADGLPELSARPRVLRGEV